MINLNKYSLKEILKTLFYTLKKWNVIIISIIIIIQRSIKKRCEKTILKSGFP